MVKISRELLRENEYLDVGDLVKHKIEEEFGVVLEHDGSLNVMMLTGDFDYTLYFDGSPVPYSGKLEEEFELVRNKDNYEITVSNRGGK